MRLVLGFILGMLTMQYITEHKNKKKEDNIVTKIFKDCKNVVEKDIKDYNKKSNKKDN